MKKIAKLLCGFLGICFLVTGCATVGNIKNNEEELIHNGTSVVTVSDHVYFGNSIASYSEFNTDADYKQSAKNAYLARIDGNDVVSESKDFSPENTKKVNSEVVGQDKSFMFALGKYVYFTTPNRKKVREEDGTKYYFNYTTLYRTALNGDGQKELYTTNGEVSQIEVLKADGNYYVVMLAGKNLVKVKITGGVDVEVLADDATSVALPETYEMDNVGSTLDWNGYIYYTTAKESTNASGNLIKRVSIANGEIETMYHNDTTVTFVDRERDVVFFTENSETYKIDLSADVTKNAFINGTKQKLYAEASVSNINLIATQAAEYGYVFMNSANTLVYQSKDASKGGAIAFKNAGEAISGYKLLQVSGRTVYLGTTTAIYRADLSALFAGANGNVEVECETVVKMTNIHDGTMVGFDHNYVYFYAQLQEVEAEEVEESEETEADTNYYLYRASIRILDETKHELLSKVKDESRHS